ncbi:unnamed protein product [Effrenium voratum]|uniref:Uncharacterized protein n=1 Tax=Effrenium voratum TaxID=2562239 RepID=A0AA36NBE2_9DINO|nr:unnamed protein product [Effrenium voratum]CAJ1424059.1 unnamed protein product [Effrenium voratum]
MRREDEPRESPPDCSEHAGGGFAVGMPVQCFNQNKKEWEDGNVTRRYQQDKVIVFDVDCKGSIVRMLPASRLRHSRFAVGDNVMYYSNHNKSWVTAKVQKIFWSKRTCDLDIKKGELTSAVSGRQAREGQRRRRPPGRPGKPGVGSHPRGGKDARRSVPAKAGKPRFLRGGAKSSAARVAPVPNHAGATAKF